MWLMWYQNSREEDWGFLLINMCNAFNEKNRTAIMWAVRHKWPSGVRFSFNCYRHWAKLAIRSGDRTGQFLHSK